MSDPDITDLPATWRTWIQVFADLRQLSLETATHGWWLDVGRRQQAARYFLTEIDLALFRDLASSIEEPAVHLEMLAPRQIVEALLPEGWSLAASEYLMTAAIEPECIPAVPEDVQLVLNGDDDGIRAGCLDRDGHALSRGICGVIARDAVFDQIVTEPPLRRQGLASAVMSVLSTAASRHGADRGILLATAEGRPFYEALGWTVLSEVSKAVSPFESRRVSHLRIVSGR